MANTKKYDGLSTSELRNLVRERGLTMPQVNDVGELAAWLRAQDSADLTPKKAVKVETVVKVTEPMPTVTNTDLHEDEIVLEEMTIAQLRSYAAEHNFDLGTATKRDDLIAAVKKQAEAK